MGFGGTLAPLAALLPFGTLISPKWGVGVSYDADGNLQFTTPGGTTVTPDRIDDLLISGSGDILAALADNTDDGSAADTGLMITAVAGANQSGLPANFGIGRGNWAHAINSGLPSSVHIDVSFQQAINTVAAVTNAGGPQVRVVTQGGGDITIAVKNMSEVALASGSIRVELRHTLIG